MLIERRFYHLENVENLIMWEIRWRKENELGEVLSSGRLLFNNQLDNLDQQPSLDEIINAFMHWPQRSVVVSLNYGHTYA